MVSQISAKEAKEISNKATRNYNGKKVQKILNACFKEIFRRASDKETSATIVFSEFLYFFYSDNDFSKALEALTIAGYNTVMYSEYGAFVKNRKIIVNF